MPFAKKIRHVRLSLRTLGYLWREEFSFRVQIVAALILFAVAALVGISRLEWVLLVLAIGAVLATEAINTALEELCDHITPEHHPRIARIKELGASASLIVGIAAAFVAGIIIIPMVCGSL